MSWKLAFKTSVIVAVYFALVCTGDDFPDANSLLEAIFAMEEDRNPLREADSSQGTIDKLLYPCPA